MRKNSLIEINEIEMNYHPYEKEQPLALHPLSLTIYKGENFALVGESGSGKSTLAKILLKLIKPTKGSIFYKDRNILELKKYKDVLNYRKDVQMVFQDPAGSLNPRMTVKKIIGDALKIHHIVTTPRDIEQEVTILLKQVGLDPAFMNHYPRELSGGQCQRVGIARALALRPEFIVADEALSALDVSIQAQILNLLKGLKDQKQLTYLFIAHDLGMVKYLSDRIGVMHQGRLMEIGSTTAIFKTPLHPYTKALFSAIPSIDTLTHVPKVDISYQKPSRSNAEEALYQLREIKPDRWVYCLENEIAIYRQQLH